MFTSNEKASESLENMYKPVVYARICQGMFAVLRNTPIDIRSPMKTPPQTDDRLTKSPITLKPICIFLFEAFQVLDL